MKHMGKFNVLHGVKNQTFFATTCDKNIMLNCKLFKHMFPGFKPFKSTFILCFFKHLWKHSPLWSGTKQCVVRGNQARVKNADLRHPSCTVVMYRRKSASPVHNVLKYCK